MTENVCVRTACLLKSIREDRQQTVIKCTLRHDPLFVGCLGETDHLAVIPGEDGGVDSDRAEGETAEDVTQKSCLDLVFGESIPSSAY
jgi:hypothetical protein